MPVFYPPIDPSDPFRVARLVFDGWKDAEQASFFHGSVTHLAEESAAGRFSPSSVKAGILYIDHESPEEDGVGTVPGSILQVPFYSDVSSLEEALAWFRHVGLLVHPADPPFLDLTTGPKRAP